MNMSGNPGIVFISSIIFLIVLSAELSSSHVENKNHQQLYIVYMGSLPAEASYVPREHHLTILRKVVSRLDNQSLYRSYGRSFNGFAAWLTDQERDKLTNMEGVLSVFSSETLQLHTTRSWDFMGFPESTTDPTLENDIIIGVIDSGIWPGLQSFLDDGLGPVPKKWKGYCQGGPKFKCNRKIIGAQFYTYEDRAWDQIGHGTHISSIAAGNNVRGASFNESTLAKGTARGGAPSSRIAVYKVCDLAGCISADILAAFDDAIADGVDVISISIGVSTPYIEFAHDIIAIGSFHAIAKDIVTINSAGNFGRLYGIYELAPWLISVGASSTDRRFIGKVVLGNGKTLIGRSISSYSLGSEPTFPLSYANKINSSTCDEDSIRSCAPSCVDKNVVTGKIVMCWSRRVAEHLRLQGAIGFIYISNADVPFMQPLPAIGLAPDEYEQLEEYADSTTEPRATILATEEEKDTLAPMVARFSSRGPNYRFPDILKPDVVAPGISILAAYPPKLFPFGNRKSIEYNIMSGTSVSCPHVSGTIAYVKSLHPNWSPAALKSAIMTTAWPLNKSVHEEQEFSYGSGHIDPSKAADPGLIYDISKKDYIGVLCATYDDETCLAISGEDCQCSNNKIAAKDLNYPSMTAKISASGPFSVSFTRVVTSVGHPDSTYKAAITAASGLTISVVPDILTFKDLNEKQSFEIRVKGDYPKIQTLMLSSSLVWSYGTHTVRSPIIVYKRL